MCGMYVITPALMKANREDRLRRAERGRRERCARRLRKHSQG
jgi:hypothetical protein